MPSLVPKCLGDKIVADPFTNGPSCQYDDNSYAPWATVEQFEIEDLDFEIASSSFAVGFVLVGTAWAIGMGCRVLLQMIRGH